MMVAIRWKIIKFFTSASMTLRRESSNLTEVKSGPLWINAPTFAKIYPNEIAESNIKIRVRTNLIDFDSNFSRLSSAGYIPSNLPREYPAALNKLCTRPRQYSLTPEISRVKSTRDLRYLAHLLLKDYSKLYPKRRFNLGK